MRLWSIWYRHASLSSFLWSALLCWGRLQSVNEIVLIYVQCYLLSVWACSDSASVTQRCIKAAKRRIIWDSLDQMLRHRTVWQWERWEYRKRRAKTKYNTTHIICTTFAHQRSKLQKYFWCHGLINHTL